MDRDTSTDTDELKQELAEFIRDARYALLSHTKDAKADATWAWFRRGVLAIFVVVALAFYLIVYGGLFGLTPEPTGERVAIIPITGEISEQTLTSADRLVPLIRRTCRDPKVKGVILKITSPGGSPTQAERIASALDTCRTEGRETPVIAVIEAMGASAAYLIAAHADEIVANRFALVGSIGAVLTQFEVHEGLDRLGVRQRAFTSGTHKGMLSMYRPSTQPQDGVSQALVDEAGSLFKQIVIERRYPHGAAPPEVLWSGRVWSADEARSLGLIDQVAVIEDILDTRFPGVSQHIHAPRQTLQERLEITALIDAFAARMATHLQMPAEIQ